MNEVPSKRLQAEANRRVAEHAPPDGWKATVAIVIANRPALHLLGTGNLFEIGGCHFVVTAAHVIDSAHVYDRTIGISDGSNGFISVHGNWIRSAPTQQGGKGDPFDIAIYELPPSAVARLNGKRFLRREDIDFREQSGTAVFSLFGFPALWALPSRSAEQAVSLKPLEYTTYAYVGDTKSILGYDSKYHLLIDSNPTDITESNGAQAVLIRRNGELATIPRDLKGISGCAVWAIGDMAVPLERWRDSQPKVVAVETGIYQESHVIRATRWVAVTTLIHEAFPVLRSALQLWMPD